GLPGGHHFYVTFRTDYPGVSIPEYLHGQYPDTMTIVLQHQFWGLDVQPDKFAITLSFRKVHERLTVPFDALTAFADPSVNFALQFDVMSAPDNRGATVQSLQTELAGGPAVQAGGALAPDVDDKQSATAQAAAEASSPLAGENAGVDGAASSPNNDTQDDSEKVVVLDAFRKK
ncbi:MAG: ClpXP protease specificity-enhancing factor SspB, partial [Pseudomonadota bacterium]